MTNLFFVKQNQLIQLAIWTSLVGVFQNNFGSYWVLVFLQREGLVAVPGAVLSLWPQGEGPRAGQDHLTLKTPVETEGHTRTGQFWVNTSLINTLKKTGVSG